VANNTGAGGSRITAASGSLTISGAITANFTSRSLDLRGAGNGIINGNFIDGAGANVITGFSKNDARTWALNGNNAISCTTVMPAGGSVAFETTPVLISVISNSAAHARCLEVERRDGLQRHDL
jgi:hypothetical protein